MISIQLTYKIKSTHALLISQYFFLFLVSFHIRKQITRNMKILFYLFSERFHIWLIIFYQSAWLFGSSNGTFWCFHGFFDHLFPDWWYFISLLELYTSPSWTKVDLDCIIKILWTLWWCISFLYVFQII